MPVLMDLDQKSTDENFIHSLIPSTIGPGICAGCGILIADRFFLQALEQNWHLDCLKCCSCQRQLDGDLSCYTRDGLIYCKIDYYRQFCTQCARCHQPIVPNELVMHAKEFTYHLHCFACCHCGFLLSPGEYFAVNPFNATLYCSLHYKSVLSNLQISPDSADQNIRGSEKIQSGSGSGSESPNKFAPDKKKSIKGSKKKRKSSPFSFAAVPHQGLAQTPSNSSLDGSVNSQSIQTQQAVYSSSQRTKRMRTSFKHAQLKAMKAYFQLNHNPDAKDLKQLASRTGLTKRVLQVWFQNARAKFRRSQAPNSQSQENCGGESENGILRTGEIEVGSVSPSLSSPNGNSTPFVQRIGSATSDDPNLTTNLGSPRLGSSLSDEDTTSKSLADYFMM